MLSYKELKLLQLQILKSTPRYIGIFHGDLQKKGRRGSQVAANSIVDTIQKESLKSQWKYVPRAKVAISMHFFAKEGAPAIQNLVKFYLDLLYPTLFNDDRQVGYLSAQCYQTPREFASEQKSETVIIEVERLSDLKRRFDLYHYIHNLSEKDYELRQSTKKLFNDDDNEIDDVLFDIGINNVIRDRLNLPTEYIRFEEQMIQKKLLELNKIDFTDRPGGAKNPLIRQRLVRQIELRPWSVYLGELPKAQGETEQYKQNIRQQIQQLRSQFRIFNQIQVPVELDVQVGCRLQLIKDLDNIIRDIVPIFSQEVLSGTAQVQGYRVYTVADESLDSNCNTIRLKLLPPGGIAAFEDNMKDTLKEANDWIIKKL